MAFLARGQGSHWALSAILKRTPAFNTTSHFAHLRCSSNPYTVPFLNHSATSVLSRPRAMSTAVGEAIKLQDGRYLGYNEFGDPQGTPVVYIHGSPDSGMTLSGFEGPLAKRLGVRWIAPDRPGIGRSTFQPNRKVADYPSDLRQLMEQLNLDRYRILGTSGGTGYTLACAQQLPKENLLAVGICAGVGPWEAGLTGTSETMEQILTAWREYPDTMISLLEKIFVEAAQDPDPSAMDAVWRAQIAGFDPQDQKVLMKPDAIKSAVKVFRQVFCQGGAGHLHDMKLNTQHWGLDCDKIGYEGIKLWYGGADDNTPPQMGRYMAERLPKSIYKEYPGDTHYSIWREERLAEFLQDLLE